MKAVILAAGRGTRLGDLTRTIPKPMIQVAGKPVLEHIIRHIQRAGINDFVLVTRYLSEKVEGHFGDGAGMGAHIEYTRQSDAYGTGAALLAARGQAGGGDVLMCFGDVITSPECYRGVMDAFNEKRPAAVMTLNWMEDPWRGAAVMTDDDGRISEVIEKPPKGEVASHWNSAGIFAFDPLVFDYLERLEPSPRGEYELVDAFIEIIRDGLSVYPFYYDGPWKDVGTLEDIAIAEEMLK